MAMAASIGSTSPSIWKSEGMQLLSLERIAELQHADNRYGDELTAEVIRGDWGNGETRKQRLTAAGYDYAAVQAKVSLALRCQ